MEELARIIVLIVVMTCNIISLNPKDCFVLYIHMYVKFCCMEEFSFPRGFAVCNPLNI